MLHSAFSFQQPAASRGQQSAICNLRSAACVLRIAYAVPIVIDIVTFKNPLFLTGAHPCGCFDAVELWCCNLPSAAGSQQSAAVSNLRIILYP